MSGIYTIIFVVLFFLFHQKWFHQLVGQVLLAGRYLKTFRSLISMAGSGYNDVNIFLYIHIRQGKLITRKMMLFVYRCTYNTLREYMR